VEILVAQTMSSLPIGDRVAVALAVIDKEGVSYIEAHSVCIPVRSVGYPTASPPLNREPAE